MPRLQMDSDMLSKFPCGGGWWKIQHPFVGEWQQSFYDAPPDKPAIASDANTHVPRSEVRTNVPRGKNPTKTVCEYILQTIDPCASLYTKTQTLDALQWLKQRLFNFVSSDAHLYLGPKKSRILSSWLSGNSCKPDSETIVREFVELILGENAKNIVLQLDRRGNWYVNT